MLPKFIAQIVNVTEQSVMLSSYPSGKILFGRRKADYRVARKLPADQLLFLKFELISLPLSIQKILLRFRHQYVAVHIERTTWFLVSSLVVFPSRHFVPRFGRLRFPITSPFGRPLSAFRLADRISPEG